MRFFNRRPASAATRHHGFQDRALLRQAAAAATATAAATTCDFQTAGLPAQLQVQQQQHRSSSSCHVFHGKPAIHSSRSCNTRRSSSCHSSFFKLAAGCRRLHAGAFKPAAGRHRLWAPSSLPLLPAAAGCSCRRRPPAAHPGAVLTVTSAGVSCASIAGAVQTVQTERPAADVSCASKTHVGGGERRHAR